MKKKAIKIAASTAVAASAFVAVAPANQADAATNVNQLVTDAQNAGTVLKWAISVEGSADYTTRPYDQYNAAKKAIAAAETAATKLSTSEKLNVEAKLVDAKIQVKRAQAYIDAITSSEKIQDLTAALDAAIKTDDIEKVEAAYHTATAEYRKQAALLDRVYGQSTRDGIRNAVKPAIEKLVSSVKNEVTVNMLSKAAAADVKAGKLVEAAQKIADAQAILDANVLKWETSLQKSVNDVATSLPLSVLSVTRVNDTTLTLKLNKAVDSVNITDFSIDNGLAVTSAVLGSDKKTVTLTTTAQTAGKTYTLTFKGTTVAFTVPVEGASNVSVDQTTFHKETTENLPLVATFKETNGQPSQAAVNVIIPAGLKLVSLNGVAQNTASQDTVNGFTVSATPNAKGEVVVVVTAAATGTPALDKVVKFEKLFNNTVVDKNESGELNFYVLSGDTTLSSTTVDFVDAANSYFVSAGHKYVVKGADVLQNESSLVDFAGFKSALTVGDKISGSYYAKTSSNLNIVFNQVLSALKWDASLAYKTGYTAVRVDDSRVTLKGKGQPGYEVFIYKAGTASALGKTTVNSDGTWSFTTNIDKNAIVNFSATQQTPGLAAPGYNTTVTDNNITRTVIEGAYTISSIVATTASADTVLTNDLFTFNVGAVQGQQDDVNVTSTASITVVDSDGTKVKFTNNSNLTEIKKAGNAFTVKFGYIDTNNTNVVLDKGADSKLTGTLTVIDVQGVTNAYGLKVTLETNDQIIGGTY